MLRVSVVCVLLAAPVLLFRDGSLGETWRVFHVTDQTLGEISLLTDVSLERLIALNQLDGSQVRWGQGLLVPTNAKTRVLPRWRRAEPAPGWRECHAVGWVPLEEKPDARCVKRVCAGEACACSHEDTVELSFGDAQWTTQTMFSELDGFLHARVDLDGDGAFESVVSLREGVGNGIAVEWWQHTVISGGRPVASFHTVESGHAFVEQPRGCAFLATGTDWREDQLRGEGLYWVGQLHVLQGGAMRAVGPEVSRRYTHRFAAQRWATLEHAPARVVPWFSDEGAFVWPHEEEERTCRTTVVVREAAEGRFELDGLGTWQPRGWHEEGEPVAPEYDALIDVTTGAPLLEDYRPFGEVSWSGRTVTVCDAVVDGRPRTTLGL